MKKLFALILIVACAGVALGQMDNVTRTYVQVATNSNSETSVLRGWLEGVYVDVAALKTNTVLITTTEGTLFSKDISTDGFFPIRTPMYGTTGLALLNGAFTNGLAPLYGKWPIAGPVTIRAAHGPGTAAETTNSITIKLIYSK